MDHALPVNVPTIMFEFKCKKHKQKTLINALCRYSNLNLAKLAVILDIPLHELDDVHHGEKYLNDKQGEELAQLFVIFFGE